MSSIEQQNAVLKYLLSYIYLRDKRLIEMNKLKHWLDQQDTINQHLIQEYKTNTLYQDIEVQKIVLSQIENTEKLYFMMRVKYDKLLRFVKNGNYVLSPYLDEKTYSSYPTDAEMQHMENLLQSISIDN